jgi:poly(3-hydroxybutyrate) depolymerase
MTAPTRSFLGAALLAAPVLAFSAEELFKPNEYDGIGKKLTACIEARNKSTGIDKSLEDLAKELEKVGKRIKRDPLSMPGEMGKALWASFDYDKKGSVAKGKVAPISEPVYWEAKDKLNYAVWMPPKYDTRKSYPLILCITDVGEKPTDHLTERWVDPDIRENAILVAVPTPAAADALLEGITGAKETGMGNVGFLYSRAIRNYAVDFDRVYLAGHGRGVELALAYGANFPDRFAGVIGRAGDASTVVVENLRNLPTYFSGAGAKATELADKAKELAYDNVTIQPEGKEADIWSWMQTHPRVSNPTDVVLFVGSPAPNRAYWMEVRPSDGQGTPYLKAKADRATNTITVEGEGVPKFTLYFNDVLLDLDKPVTVVANGTTNERTVPRNLQRTMDLVLNSRSDPGKFYVASMDYDLPPKPKPKDKQE